jgi:lysophospholipase L1-like esterase
MKLSGKTLIKLTKGAVYYTEERGYYTPYRYSKAQIDYMADEKYDWGWRMRAAFSGGIRLEFKTDSENISFDYRASHEHERANTVDLYVNGVLTAVYKIENRLKGSVSFNLPKGEKLVTIYYPHHADGKMFDVTLGTGAKFALAPKQNTRILFIGDSITHGSSAAQASMSYAHQVARVLDAEVVNQGISGEGFNPAAVDSDLDFTPDLVSVSYGTNDWSHSPSYEDMEARANNHLQALRLKYPDAKIAVILPIWRADYTLTTKKVGSFEDARTLLREAAARVNATVIDGMLLVPHVAEVFADARLHPSALGFQFYAENLAPHFKKILEK